MSNDIRTTAIVLRRTNYGEGDRILTLITEQGSISAIARGVRKEKSKLAGGIEMFCVSDMVIHEGKNNKLGIVTSAKMLEAYSDIVVDLERLEIGSNMLRMIHRVADSSTGPEYFNLLKQSLRALNAKQNINMIEAWFLLNFAKISGEEVNLFTDSTDAKLSPNQTYVWSPSDRALAPRVGGNIGPSEIKLMRLMVTSDLDVIARVKDADQRWLSILHLAKSANRL